MADHPPIPLDGVPVEPVDPKYQAQSESPRPYMNTERPIILTQPTLYPYGPDTPASCQDTAGASFAIMAKAEMDGISLAEAKRQIDLGCDDKSDYNTPRSGEVYPWNAADGEG